MLDVPNRDAVTAIDSVGNGLDSWLVIALIGAQNAFDPANHAANRSTDDRTDRAGTAISLVCAVGHTARDALRLRRNRQYGESGEDGRNQYSKLHEVVLPMV
jgi:hypothetical protein